MAAPFISTVKRLCLCKEEEEEEEEEDEEEEEEEDERDTKETALCTADVCS